MADDDIRLAVVGFGARAAVAMNAHRPGKGSRIVLVCDPAEAGRARAREQLGVDIEVVADFDAVLTSSVDGVFLTSPDHLHEQQAVALLEAGLPLFLEKPIAITTTGADHILATAAATGTPLYVGHNLRHNPLLSEMKRLIDAGAIGSVMTVWVRHFVGFIGEHFYKHWHADQRNVNSLLLQKATHDIDIVHWFAGGYSTRVNALGDLMLYGDPALGGDTRSSRWFEEPIDGDGYAWPPREIRDPWPVRDVEDVSMMQMRLDNGVLAAYQQCNFTPDYWRNYTVIGTEGRLENFGDGKEGSYIALWDRRTLGWPAQPDHRITVAQRPGGHHGADPVMTRDFLRFLAGDTRPVTAPVAARWSVAAGAAATESLRAGGVPVDVPPLATSIADHFAAALKV